MSRSSAAFTTAPWSVTTNTYGGNWTLSGRALSITVTGASAVSIDCISGARICAGNVINDSGGNVQLFMLLRTN
ncbi:MAG: hypothetical protein WDO12_10660 [Pseudomonadota bacterium]